MLKKSNWRVTKMDDAKIAELKTGLNVNELVAKILVKRNITSVEEAKKILHPSIEDVHDPFLLYGMSEFVERVQRAIELQQRILVYGDYDADGVTSTTVLMKTLQQLGADVQFSIPNRFEDGYGPSIRLFEQAKQQNIDLIITVDNGVSGHEAIQYAKDQGMDVIVTDHHEIGETLPNADIIIHPKHPDGNYPFGYLAGVGVAFKAAHALLGEMPMELLPYVSIGTIADLVLLKDENRYFVKEGLRRLKDTQDIGLHMLAKVSNVALEEANEETVGFSFGPRINAIGRLGEASPAVDLFLTEDPNEAEMLAKSLHSANTERQGIVATITKEAIEQIEQRSTSTVPNVLIVAGEGWNPGVVGIVASRIVEKYHRPTIVLGIDREKGIVKGSARSIEGYHLYNELAKQKHLLLNFGGHPMAAGLTVELDQFATFKDALETEALTVLSEEQLIPTKEIDIEIQLENIDIDAIESLSQLRPFGMGFEKPAFGILHAQIADYKQIGANKNHLKMTIVDEEQRMDVIGFSKGELANELTHRMNISVIGDLQINEWNNKKSPQLLLKDLTWNEWRLLDVRGIRQPARLKSALSSVEASFIAFRNETIQSFQTFFERPIVHFSKVNEAIHQSDHVVLLDLPNEKQQLKEIIQVIKPTTISAHFAQTNSLFFSGMPTREQFKWYYSFLISRNEQVLAPLIDQIHRHKGWPMDIINFMTEVFFDLGFVKINNGRIEVLHVNEKKPLQSSPVYQARQHQMELEEQLLYANYSELRNWFEMNTSISNHF